jgi:hypothetical protein
MSSQYSVLAGVTQGRAQTLSTVALSTAQVEDPGFISGFTFCSGFRIFIMQETE